MEERRKFERFNLELPVRLSANSSDKTEIFELQSGNISAAGALLMGAVGQIPVGIRCQLELTIVSGRIKELTGAQGLIKIEGTVVRSTPTGVAVCFDGDCQILGLK